MAIISRIALGGESLAQGTADIMHRAHGLRDDDLLLAVFEETLTAGKTGDWATIGGAIKLANGKMETYHKIFGVDVKPKLDQAVDTEDLRETLKYLAQLVYLEMKGQFKLIMDTKASDFLDSKARFDKAREYYTKVLSGNIKRRDPKRHERIEAQFIMAEAALGNPGIFLNLPVMRSDLKKFAVATKTIEDEVGAVYTYFKE